MTTHKDTIDVKIDDDETGEPTIIPVDITYLVERDNDYGADADGRRGTKKTEVYVLNTAIPHGHLRHMTVAQIEYVVDRAIKTATEGVKP